MSNRFLCIKIIDCNVKKFGYNEHPLLMISFFCIFLLVVSGTLCKVNNTLDTIDIKKDNSNGNTGRERLIRSSTLFEVSVKYLPDSYHFMFKMYS